MPSPCPHQYPFIHPVGSLSQHNRGELSLKALLAPYRKDEPTHPHPLVSSLPPVTGLGTLAVLSNETLFEMLSHLDIASALDFAPVSRRARATLGATLEHRVATKHATHAIGLICRFKLSPYIRFADLKAALHTRQCSSCGGVGDRLFLPTAARCCRACLESSDEFKIVELKEANFTQWQQV